MMAKRELGFATIRNLLDLELSTEKIQTSWNL